MACSIPIKGSGVPPDLLTTTNKVDSILGRMEFNLWEIPSGSTLSRKCRFNPIDSLLNDSLISNGPKPLPPIPIQKTSVYFFPSLLVISPFNIDAPNFVMS